MMWEKITRTDWRGSKIADRHYTRQKPGTRGYVQPGRCLCLYARKYDGSQALWVTSWPYKEYVLHEWGGAWICSMFRNEGAGLSSQLIIDAVAITRYYYGDPPEIGMITFVRPDRIRSTNPGYCYKKAGWKVIGKSKTLGLPCLQLLPDEMPPPAEPLRQGWYDDRSSIGL